MCLTMKLTLVMSIFFFFNDTATTEIYTLSLHDALPIFVTMRIGSPLECRYANATRLGVEEWRTKRDMLRPMKEMICLPFVLHGFFEISDRLPSPESEFAFEAKRSEEHTSELQSRLHLVC